MSIVGASTHANICRAFVWSGKCPSGICLVEEVSIGDVSGRGGVPRGSVLRGRVRRGNVRRDCVRESLIFGEDFNVFFDTNYEAQGDNPALKKSQ